MAPPTMGESCGAQSDMEDNFLEVVEESVNVFVEENELNDNDVLCGRGAAINYRSGNRRFRALIRHFQPAYMKSAKKENKTKISRAIVEAVRNAKPPGRFLKKHPTTNAWYEIGDKKAWEKTSQTLRDLRDNSDRKCKSDNKTRSAKLHQPERQTQHWYQEKDRQFQLMKLKLNQQSQQNQQQHQNIPPMLNATLPAVNVPVPSMNSINAPPMPPLTLPPHVMFPLVNSFPPNPAMQLVDPSSDPKRAIPFQPVLETDLETQTDPKDKDKDNKQEQITTLKKPTQQQFKTDKMSHYQTQQKTLDNMEQKKLNNNSLQSLSEKDKSSMTTTFQNDEKPTKRKPADQNFPTEQKMDKRSRVHHNNNQCQSPTHSFTWAIPKNQTDFASQQPIGETMERDRNDTAKINDHNYLAKAPDHYVGDIHEQSNTIDSTMQKHANRTKESAVTVCSTGSQTFSKPLTRKSIETQTSDFDVQSQSKESKITSNGENKRSAWPSTDWPLQDLADQTYFQEFQATLLRQQKESEIFNGTFSSDHISLMQELSKWSYKPNHSEVETLQAHMYGYLFYPNEQRSSTMAHLLDKICDQNKISPLKVIHLAAMNILSRSQLTGHTSYCPNSEL